MRPSEIGRRGYLATDEISWASARPSEAYSTDQSARLLIALENSVPNGSPNFGNKSACRFGPGEREARELGREQPGDRPAKVRMARLRPEDTRRDPRTGTLDKRPLDV